MPDFTWSEKAGRYRDASGRFVPEARVRTGVDVLVTQASDRMRQAAQDLRAGSIDVAAFQAALHRTIREVHIASALAAYGGRNAMTPERWGYVGSKIKRQYQYGRDFVADVISGKQSMNGRIDVRASMYAEAGRVTFEAVRAREGKRRGFSEERNVLHANESCSDCIDLTARGWVESGTLPPVGSRKCLSRCRCSIERRS
jgi:hypothetical protein